MRVLLLIGIFAFLSLQARAELFYYTDEEGTLHAVDSPGLIPAKYQKDTKSTGPTNAGTNTMSAPAAGVPAGKENVIHLKRENNSMLLEVNFAGYMGREEKATMILDTGAAVTMISNALATKLSLPPTHETRKIQSATQEVAVPTILLPKVSLGDFSVENIKATVNDLPGKSCDGLLGMDFFNKFRMRIDAEAGELHLERK